MKFGNVAALAMSLWTTAMAKEIKMDQTDQHRSHCAGMYSRKAWGGPVEPFILVKFLNNSIPEDVKKPTVSMLVFEWDDLDLVGIPGKETENNFALCDDDYIKAGTCNSTHRGEFILSPNATDKSNALVVTKAIDLHSPVPIRYAIKKTGYYCLVLGGFSVDEFSAVAEFRNAYGELPATLIPQLPFYGGISIVYTLMAGYWGFLYYQHRHDILAVQNYITAILIVLVVEMILTWGYYDSLNVNGETVGSKALMIIVGIVNSARNSFTFFLLLIVCMGYGVVKHTLGRAMIYIRILAAVHFIFGLVYSITFLLVPPEETGVLTLFLGLPLIATTTAFYVWTLNALGFTLKDLRERKQYIKEGMYKKLWWAILGTVCFVFFFTIFVILTTGAINTNDFVAKHWKTRWFTIGGWLNLVYLVDAAWIAYIWRPTANNRRFAMSDEIAQDDDGNFEIGNIGLPGDSSDEEDEEAQIGKDSSSRPGQQSGVTVGQPGTSRGAVRRDSIEGETIFAVGEDADRFSDDGSEDERLVKTK